MNHGLTLIVWGIWGGGFVHVHVGYTLYGQGPWPRGDSALGPPV